MADDIKRLNYFNGQFLREQDFSDEQKYHLEHQRDHARLLHTPGIAEGLEILDPPAGSVAVTIKTGVAYDDTGRRIVLANNKQLDLSSFAPGQPVFVTIAYQEEGSDPTNETGISGNTRHTEIPLIEGALVPPQFPNQKLVLGIVNRSGTTITDIDPVTRLHAGAKGGDLTADSLTMRSDTVASGGWAMMRLASTGRIALNGSLSVSGTITGQIGANLVGTAQIADGAVTAAKIADLNVGTADLTNLSVTNAKLADLSVTNTKLADGSVTGTKLVAGSVGTSQIADGSVTGTKIAASAVGLAQLADLSVTNLKLANSTISEPKLADLSISTRTLQDSAVIGTKIAALSVANIHLADNAVTANKILDLSVGTTKLANLSVTNAKLADGSVTATKLASLSVGTVQLGDLAVTEAKVADNSISLKKLKLLLIWDTTTTIAAGQQAGFNAVAGAGVGGILLVDVYATTLSANVTWSEVMITATAGSPVNVNHNVIFKNNGSTSVSIAFKIYQIAP